MRRLCAGAEHGLDPAGQGDDWTSLESQLALAAATPGTVAELLLRVSPPPPSSEPLMSGLRAVAWLRLGSPLDQAWAKGADSAPMWSLLLAPVPVDQHDEWVLATIHRLSPGQIAGLTLGRKPLPTHAATRKRPVRPSKRCP